MVTVGKVESGGGAPAVVSGEEQRQRQSRIDEMRDRFAKQPKHPVRLSEDTQVTINGYGFLIKGRERVMVPESVYLVLEQAGLV